MPQMTSNDPRYLDLLQKYNTLLKMYRSRPATQQIRMGLPVIHIMGMMRKKITSFTATISRNFKKFRTIC